MPLPHAIRRLNIALAASGPGSWLFSRILHHIDPRVFRWTRGKTTLTSLLTGLPIILLTTTGRKSGQPRTVPLLAIQDPQHPQRWILVASNWGQSKNPGWYYNLKAHPEATGIIAGGAPLRLRATEATGQDYDRFWQLAQRTYPGFPRYRERAGSRHIPIMVLEPLLDASAQPPSAPATVGPAVTPEEATTPQK